MNSDFQHQQYQHHFQGPLKQFNHQKQQLNSLTRFCSAPSSYFASFLDAADSITNPGDASGGQKGDLSDTRVNFYKSEPLSPETENILARFMSSMDDGSNSSHNISETKNSMMQPEVMVRVKQENDTHHMQQQKRPKHLGDYNTTSNRMYPSASKPPLASQHTAGVSSTPRMKTGIGGSSGCNLTRHNSTPAGFFSDLIIDGYSVLSGLDNYGSSSTSNDQINYSSGQPSSTSGLIRQSSDVQGTIMRMNSLEETKFSNNHKNESNFTTALPMSSWDNSILSENISSLDGRNDERGLSSKLNSSDNQDGETRNRPPLLAHHLSLPNTSAELSDMEKLLNLHDAVPLRVRAKRGFATHPRSIAERVRKNKISERMRKLQDLVPNMDKQTNNADMLDLAVDYIKNLQNQIKNMQGNRAKCTCPI